MDVEMPEMNGIAATRQLHAEYPQLRIVALSMHDEQEVAREILEAGALAFFKKNLPTHELVRTIREAYGAANPTIQTG
jgi:DNA-binding NarL/FixJ family response regulator